VAIALAAICDLVWSQYAANCNAQCLTVVSDVRIRLFQSDPDLIHPFGSSSIDPDPRISLSTPEYQQYNTVLCFQLSIICF